MLLKGLALREARRGLGIVCSYCHQPVAAAAAPLVVLLHLSYTRSQQQQQQKEEEEQQQDFEKKLRHWGKQLCLHIAAARPIAVVSSKP